jgi:hypothetical protein
MSVDLGALQSFSQSFRNPQPSGWTLPLLSAARSTPVSHVRFISRIALRLPLLVETRWTHYFAEHTTLQNILPCVTV